MADAGDEPAVGAVSQLVPATLKAMHALEFAGRHLSPTALPQIIEAMAGRDDEVTAALATSRALEWPERLKPVRACLEPRRRSRRRGHCRPACGRRGTAADRRRLPRDAQLRPGRPGDLSHGGAS